MGWRWLVLGVLVAGCGASSSEEAPEPAQQTSGAEVAEAEPPEPEPSEPAQKKTKISKPPPVATHKIITKAISITLPSGETLNEYKEPCLVENGAAPTTTMLRERTELDALQPVREGVHDADVDPYSGRPQGRVGDAEEEEEEDK